MEESKSISKYQNFIRLLRELTHKKHFPKVVYLLILLGVTIHVSLRGGAFSYALFYVVLLYLPLSLLYILYSVFALKIYQGCDLHLVGKDNYQKYQLILENNGYLPISQIRLYYNPNITCFKDDFTREAFQLSFRERQEIVTEMKCNYAGGFEAGLEGYVIQDLFGVVTFAIKTKVPVRIHVLPNLTNVAHEDISRLNEEMSSGKLFHLAVEDASLGNDLRRYQEGDSLKRVHWKNFARTGEMQVRLPEMRQAEMICLVLDTLETNLTLEKIRQRDHYLEYLVSFVEYFGGKKKPVTVMYYNLGIKSVIVDNLSSFNAFYHEELTYMGLNNAVGHTQEVVKEARSKFGNAIVFHENNCMLELM